MPVLIRVADAVTGASRTDGDRGRDKAEPKAELLDELRPEPAAGTRPARRRQPQPQSFRPENFRAPIRTPAVVT